MNHKLFLLLVVLFLTLNIVYAEDETDLKILVSSIDPQPVEPGSYFSITLKIENSGSEPKNITLNLKENHPFKILYNNDQKNRICGGCSREKTYYISVNPDAISGLYPLEYTLISEQTKDNRIIKLTHKGKVHISVKGKPDIFFYAKKQTHPLSQNDEMNINLTLYNKGSGIAKRIKITPSSSEAVLHGSNMIYINELKPGQNKKLTLNFHLSKNINTGPHQIPITITYHDYEGQEYTYTENYGFIVSDKADISIKSIKIQSDEIKGKPIEIELRIENSGNGEAKDITAKIDSDLVYGHTTQYGGILKKDEDIPIIFNIITQKQGPLHLPLKITYKDDYGTHEINTKINLYIKSNNIIKTIIYLINISILIIALFLIILITKHYLKREKNEI